MSTPREHLTPEEVHALIAGATWTVSLEESDGKPDPFGDDLPSGESEGTMAAEERDPWTMLDLHSGVELIPGVWVWRARRPGNFCDFRFRVLWRSADGDLSYSPAFIEHVEALAYAATVADMIVTGKRPNQVDADVSGRRVVRAIHRLESPARRKSQD